MELALPLRGDRYPAAVTLHLTAKRSVSGPVRRDGAVSSLVLLHHKRRLMFIGLRGALQHGHRKRLLARATVRRRRMVAIELGMCRSGRIGGASGSVTVGNGKRREFLGGTWS